MPAAAGSEGREGSVRRLSPTAALWPADAVPDAHYADAFEARVLLPDGVRAEDVMRAALEGAPVWLRWFITWGWRFVLGFKPTRSKGILGWSIAESTDAWVVLEQRSRLVAAGLLLRKTGTDVTWGTRVRFESRGARPIWACVGLLHRRIVPYILGRAVATSRT